MSFKFGGSKKKWSNTSTTNASSTKTPIVPDWAANPVRGAAERIGQLSGADPTSLVAPANALQRQAAAGAAGLGSGQDYLGEAAGLARGAADSSWLTPHMNTDTPFSSGGKAYNYIDNYLNPYLQQVVDTSAADFDANAGQVRAQQALDLAGAGAFGGSGAALTQSMTEGELARGRATTLSGLRSQAWQSAVGAASGDAERATQARIANAQAVLQDRAQKVGWGLQGQQQQLTAAQQIAGLGAAWDETQRNNIAAQLAAGGALRDIDTQQRQAPMAQAQQIVAMLQGLPLGLFTGQSETSTSTTTGAGKEKSLSVDAGYNK